jgi:hypothetical protein
VTKSMLILALSGCALIGCGDSDQKPPATAPAKESAKPPAPALSEKAAAAVKTLKADIGGFGLSLQFMRYDGSAMPRITGLVMQTRPLDADHPPSVLLVTIDSVQAKAIIDYLGTSGMLDHTDLPPLGEPATGWSLNVPGDIGI